MRNSKRKAKKVPKTRNGANGISLLIRYFLVRATSNIPRIAPDQKDKTKPKKTNGRPKSQPSPMASLASPSPIQLPEEISHNNANGNAMIGPAKNCQRLGICKENSKLLNKNKPTKANKPKTIDKLSGIILCFKSYTAITKRIEKRNV